MDIKKVLKAHGYTSKEVADILNVSTVSFSRTINGNPSVDTLQKIAEAINCRVYEFFLTEVQQADICCPNCRKKFRVILDK